MPQEMFQIAQQSAVGMDVVRTCVLTRQAKQRLARFSADAILTSKPTLNYASRDFLVATSSMLESSIYKSPSAFLPNQQ